MPAGSESGTEQYPEKAPADPGCEIRPLGRGRIEVRIWGSFPPGWLAGFTAGLARTRISILSGGAKKLSPAVWFAHFEMDSAAAAVAPDGIDFLALAAERPQPGSAPAIRLQSFHLERAGGALYLELRGPDRLGFLQALLKCFTFLSLFPAEMTVETAAGNVFDRFWLKAVGGMPPSPEAAAALREELQSMTGP